MYLLDTNHCSFLMEGVPSVVNHLRSLGQVQLATSIIVAGELHFIPFIETTNFPYCCKTETVQSQEIDREISHPQGML